MKALSSPESPRNRILQIATQLFQEKGYQRTTVRDIAERVGILSGSIFHHFVSKEEILYSIMETTIHESLDQIYSALKPLLTPQQKLQELILCELLSINNEMRSGMAILFFEWGNLSFDYQQRILALREQYEGIWLSTLEECQQQDLLPLEPRLLRKLLTGSIAWTKNWYKPNRAIDLKSLAESILSLILKRS